MPKILVIEDERVVLNNILELLNEEGFEAIGADNGLMGLQLAADHMPDLIICDVMMPQLDGFGVLQTLRENPTTATIPLIFLTAKSDWGAFRRGMSLGADDYLTKPFTRVELLEAIAVRLEKQSAVTYLKDQIQHLQKSQSLQEEFVSTAAHELRGPLANIRMAVEMLHMSADASDREFYLNILQAACDHEAELINDLLDLQRLETLTEPREQELMDLQHWVPSLAEPFQLRAEGRQQLLQLNMPAKALPFATDYFALQRMLTELLNNACKYTPPGGRIVLEVLCPDVTEDKHEWLQPSGDIMQIKTEPSCTTTTSVVNASPPLSLALRPASLYIAVSNTAEVPAEALPHLFDRFYRVPGGDRWHQGGSGLGLTLVKKITEQLSGEIYAISEAGWTHFVIELPLGNG
ncbi:MAG TPA: response regulator [Crinalium sp.]|jgi:signal transduction histidine kinase